MALPALTREYTPGSRCNSRETMRFPLSERRGPIPLRCVHSNSMFTIQHVKSLGFPDGTPESPQEHPDKSRMAMISTKESEIVHCIPNQLEMRPESPLLDLQKSPIPHHTRQVAFLTLGNSRDSLRLPFQI